MTQLFRLEGVMDMKKLKRPAARKGAKPRRRPIMRHGREGVKLRGKRKAGKNKVTFSAAANQSD